MWTTSKYNSKKFSKSFKNFSFELALLLLVSMMGYLYAQKKALNEWNFSTGYEHAHIEFDMKMVYEFK